MRFSFRQEIIFGAISISIVIILIIITTIRYNRRVSRILNTTNSPISNSNIILTSEVISKHSITSDCWILIENKVYIATDYLLHHPGGVSEITPFCGNDATQAFNTKGGSGNTHSAEALRQLGMLFIGNLNGKIIKQPDNNSINLLPIGGNDDD